MIGYNGNILKVLANSGLKPIVTDAYDFPTLVGKGYAYHLGVNYDTLKRNVDTLNDTLNSRVLSLVRQRPGLRRPDLMVALNVSESTVARCLRELKASVGFRGAPKTGGYYILERS